MADLNEYGKTYDANNNVLTTATAGQGTYYNSIQQNTYGQHGNVLTSRCIGFPSQISTTAYYNASQYFQKASVTDSNGHTTMMGVGTSTAGNTGDPDSNIGDRGQTLWVQDAGYNDNASPSYHKQFSYTYNQYGQKLTETNLNGVVTQYYYGGDGSSFAQADTDADDTGNLIAVVQDPGTGHLNRTTTMHYDIMGRVLQSTDPSGQTSTFAYNSLGQPLTVQTPAKGSSLAEKISYVYDGNGRTHSVTDGRSPNPTIITYENGSDRVSSVTDPITGTISYTYVITGERNTVTLPGGGTWTYHYDIYSGSGPSFPAGFILPKDGLDNLTLRLLSITDDQGRKVEYNEDWSGHLEYIKSDEVFDTGGSLVGYSETDPTYDTSSDSRTHYWLANLTTTWHGQDVSRNPVSHMLRSDNYTEQGTDVTTGYDPNGQRLSDVITDTSGNLRTERYAYDKLNRLSTVNYGDGETQSYGFDAMGNRLTKSDTAGSTTTTTGYTYDAANRLTSTAQNGGASSAVTFDADGNTLTDTGGRTMTWDSQNRLTSCAYQGTTSTFTYGADGLRRSETANGVTTYFVYDGSTLIREMHKNLSTGVLYNTATYLTGPRGPEYRRDDTATELDSQGRQVSKCRWYVFDGLGSVVGEVDPSGNLTSSPKYDVYGLTRSNAGTASSRQGFVGSLGHVSDTETGLIYMRARYYDPSIGRFISQDPKCSGANWFVYCSRSYAVGE